MWYFLLIGIAIVGILLTSVQIVLSKNPDNKMARFIKLSNEKHLLGESDSIKAMYSKKQIEQKLKQLAETPPPKDLPFGAMCYDVVMTSKTKIDYVCPVCHEKTIYKTDKRDKEWWKIQFILDEIVSCRREIEKIKGINIKLDELQFCKHCNPDIVKPQLCLLINIAGETDTTKVCDITVRDLHLINEFLNDKLVHKTDNDGETPLVEDMGKIKKLFGLK